MASSTSSTSAAESTHTVPRYDFDTYKQMPIKVVKGTSEDQNLVRIGQVVHAFLKNYIDSLDYPVLPMTDAADKLNIRLLNQLTDFQAVVAVFPDRKDRRNQVYLYNDWKVNPLGWVSANYALVDSFVKRYPIVLQVRESAEYFPILIAFTDEEWSDVCSVCPST
eukprot:m.111159 g.111159  ORF g.111159 m.111159 type:complete len:165 (+) comp13435_c0_seq1:185-679(+)